MLKHVNENNFEEEVLNSKKAVLVDFFGDMVWTMSNARSCVRENRKFKSRF